MCLIQLERLDIKTQHKKRLDNYELMFYSINIRELI